MAKKSKKHPSKQRIIALIIALAVLALIYAFVEPSVLEEAGLPVHDAEPTPTQPVESSTPVPAPSSGEKRASPLEGTLTAHILDVGQGDSILLISPSGKTMLVDASENKYFEDIDECLRELGIEKLDVVVATHPHSDHIGGMANVINNYEIGTFYMPNVAHTSATFEKMLAALENNDVKVRPAEATDDSFIEWDDEVEVRILSPVINADYGDDFNDWSVILRVKYGETSILLTGDAEEYAEWYALNSLPIEYFDATVLKLGHHGSSSSTSPEFFDAVSPDYAVGSMGKDNEYGHPHDEIVEMLLDEGIPFFRTDKEGTITVRMDGEKVKITTEK